MFSHQGNQLPYNYLLEVHGQFPWADDPAAQPTFPLPPSLLAPLAFPTYEQDSDSVSRSELVYSSSGCSSYVGSPTSITSCDLQSVNLAPHNQRANSPLSSESNIVESMNRASPYSPEEKKERIERYRSKRNLRNFNKKIKYECRKTLADSRPRVRGRFARNDKIDEAAQSQWDHTSVEEDENWIGFLDALSANYNALIPSSSSS